MYLSDVMLTQPISKSLYCNKHFSMYLCNKGKRVSVKRIIIIRYHRLVMLKIVMHKDDLTSVNYENL